MDIAYANGFSGGTQIYFNELQKETATDVVVGGLPRRLRLSP